MLSGIIAGAARRSTKTATLAIEVVRSRLSLGLRTWVRKACTVCASRCGPSLRV